MLRFRFKFSPDDGIGAPQAPAAMPSVQEIPAVEVAAQQYAAQERSHVASLADQVKAAMMPKAEPEAPQAPAPVVPAAQIAAPPVAEPPKPEDPATIVAQMLKSTDPMVRQKALEIAQALAAPKQETPAEPPAPPPVDWNARRDAIRTEIVERYKRESTYKVAVPDPLEDGKIARYETKTDFNPDDPANARLIDLEARAQLLEEQNNHRFEELSKAEKARVESLQKRFEREEQAKFQAAAQRLDDFTKKIVNGDETLKKNGIDTSAYFKGPDGQPVSARVEFFNMAIQAAANEVRGIVETQWPEDQRGDYNKMTDLVISKAWQKFRSVLSPIQASPAAQQTKVPTVVGSPNHVPVQQLTQKQLTQPSRQATPLVGTEPMLSPSMQPPKPAFDAPAGTPETALIGGRQYPVSNAGPSSLAERLKKFYAGQPAN